MSILKSACGAMISKLEASAANCEKFLRNTVPKLHCIQSSKDAIVAASNFVKVCKEHSATCKNNDCGQACKNCLHAVQKAIEKNTACVDACSGAGSDEDCKKVCKDCADACKAASQACKGAMSKMCA